MIYLRLLGSMRQLADDRSRVRLGTDLGKQRVSGVEVLRGGSSTKKVHIRPKFERDEVLEGRLAEVRL